MVSNMIVSSDWDSCFYTQWNMMFARFILEDLIQSFFQQLLIDQ